MQVSIKTGDVTENFDSENSEITLYLSESDCNMIWRSGIKKTPKCMQFTKNFVTYSQKEFRDDFKTN